MMSREEAGENLEDIETNLFGSTLSIEYFYSKVRSCSSAVPHVKHVTGALTGSWECATNVSGQSLRFWLILPILGLQIQGVGVKCTCTIVSSLNLICVFLISWDQLCPHSIFETIFLSFLCSCIQSCSFSIIFPPEPSLVLCSARLFHLCSLFLSVSVEAQIQRAVAVLQPAVRRWLSRVRAWRLLQDSEWHCHAFNHHRIIA